MVGLMSDERRTQSIFVKFRPTLAEKVRADAESKGQPLVEWMERAALARLREREEPVVAE